MGSDLAEQLARGREALAACHWDAAADAFDAALAVEESASALDGLGQARYWQGRYADGLALRERAYAAYRVAGDHRAAALVAVRVAMVHGLVYGNAAAVAGWLGHAQRMVDRAGDCPESGWLEVFRGCITADPVEREQRSNVGVTVGRRFHEPDLEFDALAYLGQSLVEQGRVADGLALLDEAAAAATGGLVTDPWAAGEILCTLFSVCEMTVDVRRAESWLAAVDGYVERTGERPIFAICRMHLGGLLTAAGRYDDAEKELLTAVDIYRDTYTGTVSEPLLRLADLYVRQGRYDEADRLLEGYGDHGAAAVPRARLLLARGDAEVAEVVLARSLPDTGCPLPHAPGLSLRIVAALARDDLETVRRLCDELDALAAAAGLSSLTGLAARSRARLATADGKPGVRGHYEAALAAFTDAGLLHEGALTRLELAAVVADDTPSLARAEARAALTALDALGAHRDADAAARLLRDLGDRSRARRPRGADTLTPRQREVLDLLVEGRSNQQIAERLFISLRTAEHHVSNILAALGLRSRTEVAAHVLRQHRAR